MQVTICRKRWSLIFTRNLSKANHGECDHPTKKGKEIRVREGIREQSTLETLIHEMLHAANWSLDEEFVTDSARDISRVLWKLGYRRTNVVD